jgi:hypothetical protein
MLKLPQTYTEVSKSEISNMDGANRRIFPAIGRVLKAAEAVVRFVVKKAAKQAFKKPKPLRGI